MNERSESKTRTLTGVRISILRNLWLYVLGVFVVIAVICVFIVSVIPQEEPVLLAPQEIAVKAYAYRLMDRIEEALSFSDDWPDKDKYIDVSKKLRERYERLEHKLGPVEIRENETFDEATRVVVPNLSMTIKNRSTGEIITLPRQDGPNITETILEKRETAEGPRWYVISEGKRYLELKSTWLNLPRKKVADSPTIILKKAVIIQIISDGEVVSERIVFWNNLE